MHTEKGRSGKPGEAVATVEGRTRPHIHSTPATAGTPRPRSPTRAHHLEAALNRRAGVTTLGSKDTGMDSSQ